MEAATLVPMRARLEQPTPLAIYGLVTLTLLVYTVTGAIDSERTRL